MSVRSERDRTSAASTSYEARSALPRDTHRCRTRSIWVQRAPIQEQPRAHRGSRRPVPDRGGTRSWIQSASARNRLGVRRGRGSVQAATRARRYPCCHQLVRELHVVVGTGRIHHSWRHGNGRHVALGRLRYTHRHPCPAIGPHEGRPDLLSELARHDRNCRRPLFGPLSCRGVCWKASGPVLPNWSRTRSLVTARSAGG